MSERLPNGRFDKGNSASKGHGRARRPVEEKYLRTLTTSVSLEEWRAICEKAKEQALAGDKDARQFLANYLIGKPTEYVAADVTSDGEPLKVLISYADDSPDDTETT